MGLVLDTAPAVEPVTVGELRTHLRLDDAGLDDELTRLIGAARRSVEAFLKRQLITATYLYSFDEWPYSGVIRLPMPPLQTVTSIQYEDINGATQTWGASNYQVDVTDVVGTITLAYNAQFPILELGKKNAVVIEYNAGYGDAGSDVPEGIRQAILALAGHWFEQATPVFDGTINETPMHIRWMLEPEQVLEVY